MNHNDKPLSKQVCNIQTLRGIACLMVVAHHLYPFEQKCFPGLPALTRWLESIGYSGVDLFFVISGFVMITSTRQSFSTPGIGLKFVIRRAIRIFPVYWAVLIPLAVLDIVAPSHVLSTQTIRPNLFASFALLPQIGLPLLTVSWSLVYEMFFYYLYSIAISVPFKFLPPLVGVWLLSILALNVFFPNTLSPWLKLLGSTISVEFIFGMFLGWWFGQSVESRHCRLAILTGLAILAIDAVFFPRYGTDPYGQSRFFVIGLPMAMIVYGFVALERSGQLISRGFLVRVGDASYSMYLLHVPALAIISYISMHHVLQNVVFHVIWLLVALLIQIPLAFLFHTVVERPLVKMVSRCFSVRSPIIVLPAFTESPLVEGAV